MAVHGPHDPVQTAGLADGCDACDFAAVRPFETLDADVLGNLVARTRLWQTNDASPRSENEARAMRIVELALAHRLQLDSLDARAA